MQDLYFVLYCSEDGGHYLQQMTEAQLQRSLDNQDWGPSVQINTVPANARALSLECSVGLFIWKGSAVVPTPKTVVKSWSI